MPFQPGQSVGEYQILSVLGAGGMGRVYRVRNVISDRIEAMKVLLPDFTSSPDLAARFIAEIRTLAGLDHPNIAQLHTAFQVENQLVMMMEFVEGSTLEQRAKQGPIPAGEVIEYTLQVLSALGYAHSRGVVHRDVKPANVMVTAQGIVKLMDFGIARSRAETQLTQPGTTLGSVYYMSPEQVRGGNIDARSDLYSVGILLYELLSGRRPFDADSAYHILDQQLNSQATPPRVINPQIPQALNDLILFALAKDPAQRFQSAEAFRTALLSTTGRAPIPIQPSAATPGAGTEDVPWQPMSATPRPAAPYSAAPAPPSPAAPLPVASASPRRSRWVAAGALAVVALLAAAAIGLPHFFQSDAASRSAAEAAPAPTAANPPDAPSPVQPQASPASPTDSTTSPLPAGSNTGGSSNAVHTATVPVHTNAPPPRGNPQRPSDTAQTPAAAPPPPAGPSPQELEQARDRKIQLDSRAAAVSSSLDNLRRQQEADGLSLRQDIAGADSRMHIYLEAVAAELSNGDIAAAQRDMDKADREISTLETFFHRQEP